MIAALTSCSFVDYPGRLAAVVFIQGCNLRCRYCHNPDLCGPGAEPPGARAELLRLLAGRRGLLAGVVLGGGEPMLWPELPGLLREIQALGFAIKLDSNGTWPRRTQDLVAAGLVDYLAVDVKAAPGPGARWLCGLERQADAALATLAHAGRAGIACEARTVLVDGIHDLAALSWIAERLAGQGIERWRLRDVRAARVLDVHARLRPPARAIVTAALEIAWRRGLRAEGPPLAGVG